MTTFELQQQTLEIQKRIYGENDERLASTFMNLGSSYYQMGDYEKQLELQTRALEIEESCNGPNTAMVAEILTNMSSAYSNLKMYEQQREVNGSFKDLHS